MVDKLNPIEAALRVAANSLSELLKSLEADVARMREHPELANASDYALMRDRITTVRRMHIYYAHLGGKKSKDIAVAHGLSEGRISQIIKAEKSK